MPKVDYTMEKESLLTLGSTPNPVPGLFETFSRRFDTIIVGVRSHLQKMKDCGQIFKLDSDCGYL